MQVEIETRSDLGKGLVARVSGRIDTHTSADFEATLRPLFNADTHWVLVDMQDVNYVSSAGLRGVLLLAKCADETDSTLQLCGLTPEVYTIFEVTGFQNIVPIHQDEAAALASLS